LADKRLTLPVVIIAGDGDKVVFKRRSERLAASIRGSMLRVIKDSGHMVHHVAPRQVVQSVEDAIAASAARVASGDEQVVRKISDPVLAATD
jgi:pimeloyl-ACP methyl ester carboxylesterase